MSGGKQTPRQKMINLMYLVLMAMLALNVSTDVLNGFVVVEDSIKATTQIKIDQNKSLMDELNFYAKQNPTKAGPALVEALNIKKSTDSIYDYVQDLKIKIAKFADGDDANLDSIKSMDNLDAASNVMLNSGAGKKLRLWIVQYRAMMEKKIPDSTKRSIVVKSLVTEATKKAKATGRNTWETQNFESMPAIAALTILSKLQNDLKNAESEAISALIKSIDVGDFRVNSISAYAIPASTNVLVGDKYSARLILSAVDSTKQPRFFIGGQPVNTRNGLYEFVCNSVGDKTLSGYAELTRGDGSISTFKFENKYSVVPPSATVSATKMNILYAGWTNPVSISVPGVPSSALTASMSNGQLIRKGDEWVAIPSASAINSEVVITVNVKTGSSSKPIPARFRVRETPKPSIFLVAKNGSKFMGESIRKKDLLMMDGFNAELADLDIPYKVVSFELLYVTAGGEIRRLKSSDKNRASISEEQKNFINSIYTAGYPVTFKNFIVVGPSGRPQEVKDVVTVVVK